jgi:hypothetical protein
MNRDEILAIAREVENHAGWSALYLMGDDLAVAFASRIESLVREEAEKDAKRYRVLRDGGAICAPTVNPIERVAVGIPHYQVSDKDKLKLDAYLDDVIRKSEG